MPSSHAALLALLACTLLTSLHMMSVTALLVQEPIRMPGPSGTSLSVQQLPPSQVECEYVVPPAQLASAPYPEWAHYHQVWLASPNQNQTKDLELVDGYLERDIPVGGLEIDSLWSTGVNNFVWDTSKYPDAKSMIQTLHQKGVRVLLWVTSMVDTDSSNYQEGKQNGYYLNHGRTVKWWHGHGSFIDYTNPSALEWWHNQMDYVLDIGVDGWKCDGTDPYVIEFEALGGIHAHSGEITYRDYANSYYRDFLYYSRTKNPQALIWARPVNAFWSFAPHDTMFSGWVGDQDPTFDGLRDALINILQSAHRNYLNFGSDTGGYRGGGPKPYGRTTELFTRWFQMSAFCPHFENGGENEHRPWGFDQPGSNFTTDNYRNFVNIHMELVPYLLSQGSQCYAKNVSVMIPSATNLHDQKPTYPNSFAYRLGPDLFVTPLLNNGTRCEVTFPAGDSWVDYFSNVTYQAGSTHTLDVPYDRFPAFKRAGAVIPMKVQSEHSLHGDGSSRDALTLLIQSPFTGSSTSESVEVYEWQGNGAVVGYERVDSTTLLLSASAYHTPYLFLVRGLPIGDGSLRVLDHENLSLDAYSTPSELASAGRGYALTTSQFGQDLWVRPGLEQSARGVKLTLHL